MVNEFFEVHQSPHYYKTYMTACYMEADAQIWLREEEVGYSTNWEAFAERYSKNLDLNHQILSILQKVRVNFHKILMLRCSSNI
jgi:hypothetical protein